MASVATLGLPRDTGSTSETTLPEDVVELIASGVDAYVATCDGALEPESMLAMGVHVHGDGRKLTVHLPSALAGATLENLRVNPELAVTLIRPSDCKAVQVKGRVSRVRPSEETDRALQRVYRAALVEQLAIVGVPRELTRRVNWWPSVAVEIAVRDLYVQTPGPRAGEPLETVDGE